MPGAGRWPGGQIPLPGGGGYSPLLPPAAPPSPGGASLALLTVTKEERTLLRKAIIPRRPEPATIWCQGWPWGYGGGVPLLPPGLGSWRRRYLFLDQPPALTGPQLGSSAAADSASPCLRPRHRRCRHGGRPQPPASRRGDSGVTAWGPTAPAAPSCARPCRPTPPGQHGCGQRRGHGTSARSLPCQAQLAGHTPARRPPASLPLRGRPRPPPPPRPSP